eukprot:3378552-Prymnesium_polylepis.1
MRASESGAAPESAKSARKQQKAASAPEDVPKPQGRQLVAAVASVCVMSALYNCGTSTFAAFFGPLAQLQSGLDVQGVGTAITLLYALSFIVSTTCAAQAQKVLGTGGTAVLGLLLIGSGLLGMGAAASL